MKNNKITIISTAFLAVGALILAAPHAMTADPKTKLNSADTKFIQEEATSGELMLRIAELGKTKAEGADIKEFAGMVAAEHTKANAELATLARNEQVVLIPDDDSKNTKTYEKLESKSGTEFDKEFLSVMVSAHKKSVKNLEAAAKNAENSEVKMWAAKMLPDIQAHLKQAEELQSNPSVKADGATGASSRTAVTNPDNTARNERDRNSQTLTPINQGNSKADIDTTAQIRKAVLKLEDISINAQNVKIITNGGHVTLRGPVNSAEEKRLIGDIASRIVAAAKIDNQLEVKTDETKTSAN